MAGMLDGKVALVTGAGHGIGRSHALELAKHGAKVVVNDLGGSHTGEGTGRVADEVVAIIKARGGEAVADFGDVSNEAQADAMVRRGVEEWGRFDILVNNAGIVRDKTIWNMTVEDFDLVVAVHFKGSWLTCRSAARHWREEAKTSPNGKVYGRIINTTSGAGLTGNFGQSNYAPAKAALASLSQTLSLELASIGVTVNTISPGSHRPHGQLAGGGMAGQRRGGARLRHVPAPAGRKAAPDEGVERGTHHHHQEGLGRHHPGPRAGHRHLLHPHPRHAIGGMRR